MCWPWGTEKRRHRCGGVDGLDSDKHDDLPRNAAVLVAYCIPADTTEAATAAAAAMQLKSEIEAVSGARSIRRSTCAARILQPAPPHPPLHPPLPLAWIQQQKPESGNSTSQTPSEHLRVGSVHEFCLRNSTVTRQDESRRGCRRHGRHSRQGKRHDTPVR